MRAPSPSRRLPPRAAGPLLLPVVLVLAAACGGDAPVVPQSAPAAVESALPATEPTTEPAPEPSTASPTARSASPTGPAEAGTAPASPQRSTAASRPAARPPAAATSSAPAATRSRAPSAPPAATAPPRQDDDGGPEAARPPRETTPPPGAPPCRAQDLTVQDADALYVAKAVHELFTIRTAGPDCTLRGVPQVSFRDAAGRTLRVDVRTGGLGLPAEAAKPVTISRATSLSFFVATPRDGACEQAAAVVTTLPGTDRALLVDTMMQVCGRTAAVSPVRLNAARD